MESPFIKRTHFRLETYREKEIQKFMANGQEQSADQLNDQLDCPPPSVTAHEVDPSIEGLIRLIESMFTDSVTGQPQTTHPSFRPQSQGAASGLLSISSGATP